MGSLRGLAALRFRLGGWASLVPLLACAFLSGCATAHLAAADLDRVNRPAFISRIEEGAGPQAQVFREDPEYAGKLKKLDPKEADRRLQVKLTQAVTRFEVSDRLRSTTLSHLPAEAPWTAVVDPARVASVLESFLVEEVPANPPDYELLKPLGADAVVEFVISGFGMRSEKGHAGAFVRGYGRMFLLDGGTVWRRDFVRDGVELQRPHLDPFRVGKEPELFRAELTALLDSVAADFARDLSPSERRAAAHKASSTPNAGPADDAHPAGTPDAVKPKDELPPGELPPPDPPAPTDAKPGQEKSTPPSTE